MISFFIQNFKICYFCLFYSENYKIRRQMQEASHRAKKSGKRLVPATVPIGESSAQTPEPQSTPKPPMTFYDISNPPIQAMRQQEPLFPRRGDIGQPHIWREISAIPVKKQGSESEDEGLQIIRELDRQEKIEPYKPLNAQARRKDKGDRIVIEGAIAYSKKDDVLKEAQSSDLDDHEERMQTRKQDKEKDREMEEKRETQARQMMSKMFKEGCWFKNLKPSKLVYSTKNESTQPPKQDNKFKIPSLVAQIESQQKKQPEKPQINQFSTPTIPITTSAITTSVTTTTPATHASLPFQFTISPPAFLASIIPEKSKRQERKPQSKPFNLFAQEKIKSTEPALMFPVQNTIPVQTQTPLQAQLKPQSLTLMFPPQIQPPIQPQIQPQIQPPIQPQIAYNQQIYVAPAMQEQIIHRIQQAFVTLLDISLQPSYSMAKQQFRQGVAHMNEQQDYIYTEQQYLQAFQEVLQHLHQDSNPQNYITDLSQLQAQVQQLEMETELDVQIGALMQKMEMGLEEEIRRQEKEVFRLQRENQEMEDLVGRFVGMLGEDLRKEGRIVGESQVGRRIRNIQSKIKQLEKYTNNSREIDKQKVIQDEMLYIAKILSQADQLLDRLVSK